ncbi:hypothetical protein [uncultured Duncaniella sp.]|uniref:hypothetical protein n=1 Tax=uncultured Duncaniella sp. TaxID=2768039 RepID=UPI0025AEC74B|nr:hypothetical protein [uncultured Duncaniella sp.]
MRYKGARLQAGARVPAGARIELEVGEGVQELIPDSVSADTDAVEINPDLF